MASVVLEHPGTEEGVIEPLEDWEQPSSRCVPSGEALLMMTDEQLMADIKRGGQEAFEEMVRRFSPALFAYLRNYLGDAEMAEDALQQTFLRLHLKCNQFDAQRAVRPWLYTVATNQAIDLQRIKRRHRMVSLSKHISGLDHVQSDTEVDHLIIDASAEDPTDRAAENEMAEAVNRAIDALPEPLRQVLLLVYYQGKKYREAAEDLDVPIGTVKSRMHTAILQLGVLLSGPQSAV